MDDPVLADGDEPLLLSDEIDAWMSFTVEDAAFPTEGAGHSGGVPDTMIRIAESSPPLNAPAEDADFADLLLDDIEVPSEVLDSAGNTFPEHPLPQALPLQPTACGVQPNSPETFACPGTKSSPADPGDEVQPGDLASDGVGATAKSASTVNTDAPASPPRSTSSFSDGPGESLGSNNRRTPDTSLTNNGGSSSDGDHGEGGARPGDRLAEVKLEHSHVQQGPSCPTVPCGPSLPVPPRMVAPPGFPGHLRYPGYPMAPHPAPLMFRPMMPFSRPLPRRPRKTASSAGGKVQQSGSQKDKADGARKSGSKSGKKEHRATAVAGRPSSQDPEETQRVNSLAGPGGTLQGGLGTPVSGLSLEEGRGEEGGNTRGEGTGSDSSDDGEGGGREGGLADSCDWEKRQARLMRNRESAQLSRQRKKFYMEELEVQLRTMSATVAELNNTIAHLTAENVNLRRQLAYFCPGGTPAPPGGPAGKLGAAPFPGGFGVPGGPTMGYRGMYAPTPVVPIPKLKSSSKKGESGVPGGEREKKRKVDEGQDKDCRGKGSQKTAKKTKAPPAGSRASVAVLGVFGFLMLFSPLLPTNPSSSMGTTSYLAPADYSWHGLKSYFGDSWRTLGGFGKQTHNMPRAHTSHGRVLMSMVDPGMDLALNVSSAGHMPDSPQSNLRGRTSVPVWPGTKPILPGKVGTRPVDGALQHETSQAKVDGASHRNISNVHLGLNLTHAAVSKGNLTQPGAAFPATLVLPGEGGGLVEIDGQLIVRAVLAGHSAAARASHEARMGAAERKGAIPLGPVETSGGLKSESLPSAAGRLVAADEAAVAAALKLPSPGLSAEGAALEPHQLKHVAMGSVQGHQSVPRMWALPAKAPTKTPGAGRNAGTEGDFTSRFQGSFIGSEMCTEVFQFEVNRFTESAPGNSPMNKSSRTGREHNCTASGAAKCKPGYMAEGREGSSGSASKKMGARTPSLSASRRLGAKSIGPAEGSYMRKSGAADVESMAAARSPGLAPFAPGEVQSEAMASPPSSMVVSILAGVDGAEGGEDQSTRAGIRKIFVVVLVDGIKYVTYACLMPTFSVARGASLIPA